MNRGQAPASRRLMIGFDGLEPDEAFVALLGETGAGGVILFARNIVDAAQTRELIVRLRGLVDWPLIVAVDQEGGPVVRVTSGATVFPGNMALGAASDAGLALAQGRQSGQELRAMGFDLNLAPVVDLQTNPANPGIGIRSFGADRAAAGERTLGYVRGHAEFGVACCLKHFPGKGAAGVDAHIDLPVLDLDLEAFRDPHLEIFRDMIADLGDLAFAVMSTHILVRGLDPDLPATLSPRVMRSILREDLGFEGTVVTDCLEMGAIVKRWGVAEAALNAAQAGHDLILVCHTPERQRAAAQRLNEALASGELDEAENAASLRRIASLALAQGDAAPTPNLEVGAGLAQTIAEAALTSFGDPQGLLPLDPKAPLEIIAGRPRSVVGAEEEGDDDWSRRLREVAAAAGFVDLAITLFEPDDRAAAAEIAARDFGPTKVLLLSWDARGQEGSRRLLDELGTRRAGQLVVAHLRNPFDQALVPETVTAVTPHGYANVQLAALFRGLAGTCDWPGTMPAPWA